MTASLESTQQSKMDPVNPTRETFARSTSTFRKSNWWIFADALPQHAGPTRRPFPTGRRAVVGDDERARALLADGLRLAKDGGEPSMPCLNL
jgi:hypothetical protein